MNKTIKHGLAGAILGGALMAGDTSQAEGFSFTEIQVHQGDGYLLGRNGFNETARTTVTLEHFSAGDIGELFFFVDFFKDHDGPSTNTESDQYGEIYAFLSGRNLGLSFAESGFIRDAGLEIGLNQGTDFSVGLIGPRVNFNVPGFNVLTFGVYAYDNWDDPFDRNLDTTYQATLVWVLPFQIGSQKFSTQGFVDFIGSQGSGVANQVVFSPQLRWDIGNAFGGREGRSTLGVEYTHFDNKFGVSGVDEDSISAFLAAKF